MTQSSNNVWAGIGNPATRSNNATAAPIQITGTSANTPWQSIADLSAAPYTSSDPNALVTAYSFAAGEHSFDLVTVNPAVADYALNSGTDFTGPRWYAPLVDSAGTPVLAQDRFVLNVRFRDFDTASLARQWGIFVGVAQNATSTVLTTMGAAGNWMGLTGVGTPNFGTGYSGSGTVATVSLANGVAGNGAYLFGGLPGKMRMGSVGGIFSTTASDDVIRVDAQALTVADATQLNLMIMPTTLGNVTTTAGILKLKMDYAITRL